MSRDLQRIFVDVMNRNTATIKALPAKLWDPHVLEGKCITSLETRLTAAGRAGYWLGWFSKVHDPAATEGLSVQPSKRSVYQLALVNP